MSLLRKLSNAGPPSSLLIRHDAKRKVLTSLLVAKQFSIPTMMMRGLIGQSLNCCQVIAVSFYFCLFSAK